MADKFFILKEVRLNNHCPECYSKEDLVLTFKQKFIENAFFKALSKTTTHSLSCKKCNTEIFPVRWSDEIEQVVDYHIRATSPKPKSLKLKGMAWLLILVLILIIFGIVYFGTDALDSLFQK